MTLLKNKTNFASGPVLSGYYLVIHMRYACAHMFQKIGKTVYIYVLLVANRTGPEAKFVLFFDSAVHLVVQ